MSAVANTSPEIVGTIGEIALRLAQGPAPRADEMAEFGLSPVAGAGTMGATMEYQGPAPYPEFARLGFVFEHPPHLAHGRVTMILTLAADVRLGWADMEAIVGPARRVARAGSVIFSFDSAVSEDGVVTAWALPHPSAPGSRVGQVRLERLDWPDDAALHVRGVAVLLADPDVTPGRAAQFLGVPVDAEPLPVSDRVTEYLAPDEALQDSGYARVGLWVWQDDEGADEAGAVLVAAVRLTPADDRAPALSDLSRFLGDWEPAEGMAPRAEGEESVRFALDTRSDEAPVTVFASVLRDAAGRDARVVDVLLYRALPADEDPET